MALLTWKLCDLRGRLLSRIDNRLSDNATIDLDGQRQASVTISTDEKAASYVQPLARVLKCSYGGTPVFAGQVGTPKWDGQAGTVEIPATCPSLRLQNAPLLPPAPVGSPYVLQLPNTDESEMIWQLILAARPTSAQLAAGVPDIGLIRGNIAQTRWRDRFYEPGQDVWEAIIALTQVLGGVDFELQPLDRTDGVLAQLNTFPRQGSDKSAQVRFEFNWGRDNCQNVIYTPNAGVINESVWQGQAEEGARPPFYLSRQADSAGAYGVFRQFTGASDISAVGTLQEHAQAEASILAFPTDDFEIVPAVEGVAADPQTGARSAVNPATGRAYGIPPLCHPNGAYWLGDTVGGIAQLDSRGLIKAILKGRVTRIELSSQGQAGEARVKLTCAPQLPSYPVS